MRTLDVVAGTAATMLLAISAASADVTVGTRDSNNFIPFGFDQTKDDYQQVYSKSAFPEPIKFTGLTFYWDQGSSIVDIGTYDIRFFYSAKPVNALSTTLADNEGALIGTFFNGPYGGGLGFPSFTITGSTLAYNPALGDLLIDIQTTNSQPTPYAMQSKADGTGTVSSRAVCIQSGSSCFADSVALVTTFVEPSPVPEPSTISSLVLGLVAVGGLRWRRSARLPVSSAPA